MQGTKKNPDERSSSIQRSKKKVKREKCHRSQGPCVSLEKNEEKLGKQGTEIYELY